MNISKNSYWRSRKGLHYEELALQWLQARGLRLLQRNFSCKSGEIDLVMLDGAVLVFVEVRFRGSRSHGGALVTITRSKQRRLLRTAGYFLLRHPERQHCACRMDVVGVEPDASGTPVVTWICGAFA